MLVQHGVPNAVILSMQAYEAMKKPRPDFVSFMQSSPLVGEGLNIERSDSLTRDVSL